MSAEAIIEDLLAEGDYEKASELAEDVQDGKISGGRTNSLGGGLALEPLRKHLTDNMPDELRDPTQLSHRLRRAVEAAGTYEHDVEEGIKRLRIWLGKEDVKDSIAYRKKQFARVDEDMQAVLESFDKAWFWQKKKYRGWCEETLDELRKLAPRSPKIVEYESQFGGG